MTPCFGDSLAGADFAMLRVAAHGKHWNGTIVRAYLSVPLESDRSVAQWSLNIAVDKFYVRRAYCCLLVAQVL